jgi:transposase
VALAKRVGRGDLAAKEEMINANLRLVVSIAKRSRVWVRKYDSAANGADLDDGRVTHPTGSETGARPVDRGRAGSKQHLLVDESGLPLAFAVTGSQRNDVTQLIPLLDAVPAVAGLRGRPRRRPESLLADRGYDHDKYRRLVWERGIKPVIARPRDRARLWARAATARAHLRLATPL